MGREFWCWRMRRLVLGLERRLGYRVIAVATTHDVEVLRAAGADWIVRDLGSVTMERWEGGEGVVSVRIADALVV
jgi:glycerol 3-phosphatase-1